MTERLDRARQRVGKPRNNASTTRGKPFAPGNPGRPRGARHKVSRAVEALLEGEAEALTRKAVEVALGGDIAALRLCLDRIAPIRKGHLVGVDLPLTDSIEATSRALDVVIAAVAGGELTPDEGASVAALLETKRRAIETHELEARVAALEVRRGA